MAIYLNSCARGVIRPYCRQASVFTRSTLYTTDHLSMRCRNLSTAKASKQEKKTIGIWGVAALFFSACAVSGAVIASSSKQPAKAQAKDNGDAARSKFFDLDRIYSKDFSYSLPREVMEKYLAGKAQDNPVPYSIAERQAFEKDVFDIYSKIMAQNPQQDKVAILTAGAPGAGKTTLMRSVIAAEKLKGRNYAYVCPDDTCLKSFHRTYELDLKSFIIPVQYLGTAGKSYLYDLHRISVYNRWRPASNGAAQLIIAHLILNNVSFYYGTTSSGSTPGNFFEFLKDRGYKIRLLYVFAPDDIRYDSVHERDKTFVQTTRIDVSDKGLLVTQRIANPFLKYADEIEFYYRDQVKAPAHLAAKWERSSQAAGKGGELTIYHNEKYDSVVKTHNAACDVLKRSDLRWSETVEKQSSINRMPSGDCEK